MDGPRRAARSASARNSTFGRSGAYPTRRPARTSEWPPFPDSFRMGIETSLHTASVQTEIPGRPLVQTHFGCPTAAALLLLSAAGCGVIDPAAAPGATARQEPASAPTSPARTGHGSLVADAQSPCAGVSLDARRDYRPRSWTDGDVSFVGGSLTFVVPSEIPVTAGASARGRVDAELQSPRSATPRPASTAARATAPSEERGTSSSDAGTAPSAGRR